VHSNSTLLHIGVYLFVGLVKLMQDVSRMLANEWRRAVDRGRCLRQLCCRRDDLDVASHRMLIARDHVHVPDLRILCGLQMGLHRATPYIHRQQRLEQVLRRPLSR
jgi:hypothetical protein